MNRRGVVRQADEALRILDVGCGTGRSWETILERAPNGRITGIDLCPAMLKKVRQRFQRRFDQLTLIEGSSLDTPLGSDCFDIAISMLHVHFFSMDEKARLFTRINRPLRAGGLCLGRDLCMSRKLEQESLEYFGRYVSPMTDADRGACSFKQSMSVATHHRLLSEAGFVEIPGG